MENEKAQNEFIDKIYKDIQELANKAIKRTYEITPHEKQQFDNIVLFINNMKEWFY